jgi:hypothetical protein
MTAVGRLNPAVMQFYSGPLMHFLSGVDNQYGFCLFAPKVEWVTTPRSVSVNSMDY